MANPFLGEVRVFSFVFPPKGWALANGAILPINTNQALFALLGTTYGGNGQTTFALPNLQDRTPIHAGASAFGTYFQGSAGGEASHTLSVAEMPAHSHGIQATTSGAATVAIGPENAVPANGVHQPYRSGTVQPVAMRTGIGLVQSGANGQPHANLQPYLALNFCIALQGIFPSQV